MALSHYHIHKHIFSAFSNKGELHEVWIESVVGSVIPQFTLTCAASVTRPRAVKTQQSQRRRVHGGERRVLTALDPATDATDVWITLSHLIPTALSFHTFRNVSWSYFVDLFCFWKYNYIDRFLTCFLYNNACLKVLCFFCITFLIVPFFPCNWQFSFWFLLNVYTVSSICYNISYSNRHLLHQNNNA